MRRHDLDLLAIDRGTITAPAGCGKTHLIAETLKRHIGAKPILVLTHTNAGVAALRSRLDRFGVPSSSYRLSTIDGWAMRLASTFPVRSTLNPSLLELSNPKTDYRDIRSAAITLLRGGHVNDILSATYARLMVDEYQDTSVRQHALVVYVSQSLPTCVLGDPMQAIFDFGSDVLANWDNQICAWFPVVGELCTPWRWINAKTEALGRWLLEAREKLIHGEPIDLRSAPAEVSWVQLDGTQDHQRRLQAARAKPQTENGCVLIIGDSRKPDSQRQFASQTPGAVTVEAVDLRDLVSFAQSFDLSSPIALEQLADFAQSVMTHVSASSHLVQRVQSLLHGSARNPATGVEKAAVEFIREPSYRIAAHLLVNMSKEPGVRTHRPTVLRACLSALKSCESSHELSFYDAILRIREQHRILGRPLPRRAVGSTLLLKGLEAEVAVILNADALNVRNLYVAMTRGSNSLTVCSRSPVLSPGC